MKRFRFRLEAGLGLRALAERSARERFGAAQQRLAAALAELRAAETRRLQLAEALAASRGGVFRPADQVGGLLALQEAERAERESAKRHAESLAASTRAREEWLAARRRLQVVEKLEERARRAHREAADKAEQAMLDELASLAAARPSPRSA